MTGLAWLALLLTAAPAGEAAERPRQLALRVGWAYGLGAEVEYRPGRWGVGLSGGYVPRLGAGGYLGLQWGWAPLGASGVVAEAGLFRGVPNPFRKAGTGLGPYALAGYTLAPTPLLSLRLVAGGGVPFVPDAAFPSFEFLAKATAGVAF